MTDLTLEEALSEVAKFGRLTKGFEKVSEVAQALQGANQAVIEKTAAAEKLQAQIDKLKADKDQLAEEVKVAADTRDQIIAEANAKGQEIVAAATSHAATVKREADAAVQAAGVKVGEANAEAKRLTALAADAKAELDSTKERTAAALEAARKTFGG